MTRTKQYQLFDALRPEEYKALEQDIIKRGVLVPVEVDEDGNILDGHNRVEIADKYGLEYDTIIRHFETEKEKREHIIKLNLARRHLDPWKWGEAFKKLLADRGVRSGTQGQQKAKTDTVSVIAEELGVNERTARRRMRQAEQYERLKPEERIEVDVGRKSPSKVLKERKLKEREKLAEEIRRRPPPKKKANTKYEVIVVDPPWHYQKRESDITHRGRLSYPSMSLEEICKWGKDLPAADDCILWLWVTNAHMRHAFTVLDAWGFAEKTILTWVKNKMGLGDWLRGKTEHCLLAVKGKPRVTLGKQTTFLEAPLREHSRKPGEFFAMVDQLCPSRNRAEYFQREPRDGWHGFGAEINQFVRE